MTDWKRSVLICTVGGAPSVVTETVWALLERRPQWVPDAIFLVTTSVGAPQCEEKLKGADSQLSALFRIHGKQPLDPEIIVPPDDSGTPISDIRTQPENVAFANRITQLIKDHTEDAGTRLHISIAGGRKTMSSYAQAAISIFGRDQDELTHVLVEPPEFEYCRDFFWPGQSPEKVTVSVKDTTTGRTRNEERDASDASIALVPSPFIRMGLILSEDAFPGGKVEYENVIEQVQLGLEEDRLFLHCASNELQLGRNHRVSLAPQLFAFYRLLATVRTERWKGFGPDGAGDSHEGWLSYCSFLQTGSVSPLSLFEAFYLESAAVAGQDDPLGAAQEKAKKALFNIRAAAERDDAQDALTDTFKRIKSATNRRLKQAIPNMKKRDLARIGEGQFHIEINDGVGKVKTSRFGLKPEPGQIQIREQEKPGIAGTSGTAASH